MSTRVTNIFELYAKLNLGMYPVARDDPEYQKHKSAWAAVGVDIEAPPPPHLEVLGEALAKDLANNKVLGEAVQVAAMAVRIATEGDAGFVYEPPWEIKFREPGR